MEAARRRAVRAALDATARAVRADLADRWGTDRHRGRRVVEADYPFPEAPGAVFDWAALCLVVDDAGRGLLVSDDDHPFEWELPGGRAEPGERPAATARREVREEAGVECAVTDLLFTERLEFDYGPPERVPVTQAVFAGRRTGGRARPGEPDIAAAEWFAPEAVPAETQYRGVVRSYLTDGG